MYSFLLKNPWFALLFLGLMVVGVFTLVGTPGNEGILARVGNDVSGQEEPSGQEAAAQSNPDASPAAENTSQPTAPDNYYSVADEFLIDDASGIDPVPDVDPNRAVGVIAEDEEATNVSEDDEIEQ